MANARSHVTAFELFEGIAMLSPAAEAAAETAASSCGRTGALRLLGAEMLQLVFQGNSFGCLAFD